MLHFLKPLVGMAAVGLSVVGCSELQPPLIVQRGDYHVQDPGQFGPGVPFALQSLAAAARRSPKADTIIVRWNNIYPAGSVLREITYDRKNATLTDLSDGKGYVYEKVTPKVLDQLAQATTVRYVTTEDLARLGCPRSPASPARG
jgi:hypothetical protein